MKRYMTNALRDDMELMGLIRDTWSRIEKPTKALATCSTLACMVTYAVAIALVFALA